MSWRMNSAYFATVAGEWLVARRLVANSSARSDSSQRSLVAWPTLESAIGPPQAGLAAPGRLSLSAKPV